MKSIKTALVLMFCSSDLAQVKTWLFHINLNEFPDGLDVYDAYLLTIGSYFQKTGYGRGNQHPQKSHPFPDDQRQNHATQTTIGKISRLDVCVGL